MKEPLATAVGVDVGLESYTSETRLDPDNQRATRGKEANPRVLRRSAKQLARAQRQLARKQNVGTARPDGGRERGGAATTANNEPRSPHATGRCVIPGCICSVKSPEGSLTRTQ